MRLLPQPRKGGRGVPVLDAGTRDVGGGVRLPCAPWPVTIEADTFEAELILQLNAEDQPELNELHVYRRDGGPSISSSTLPGRIKVSDVVIEATRVTARKIAQARAKMDRYGDDWADFNEGRISREELAERLAYLIWDSRDAGPLEESIGRHIRSRKPTTPTRLAEIARTYVEALDDGRPVQAVVDAYDVAEKTAQALIAKARAEGYLSKTTPGRAGGELTAKARRILEKEQSNG
jgi:hypothetical protein